MGPSTRAVHAGLPPAEQGAPLAPGPVLAGPFHLRGELGGGTFAYGREGNPTWSAAEAALGALEDAECVLFSSGMAAVCAVLEAALGAGDVLVATDDGYPGVRGVATDRLAPRGVEVRFVPTDTDAIVAACAGATFVWVETPSNPALHVCDIAAVAAAAHAAGARLAVDNTLLTPLGQRPLDLGADVTVHSATKALAGHSDLVLGAVSVRDAGLAEALRAHRWQGGAIAGPFEAWLLHRSLADARAATRTSERELPGARRAPRRPARRERRAPSEPQPRRGAPDAAGRPARRVHPRRRRARAALPRRARARRGGDELRRCALDRRAARPLGDGRCGAGLHPLLGGL